MGINVFLLFIRSFCVRKKAAIAKAALASNPLKELTKSNVVVQVFNNTDIAVDDYEKLDERGMNIDYPMAQ